MVLLALREEVLQARTVLEVAPTPIVRRFFASSDATYVTSDRDPSADGRLVSVVADLGEMPLRDHSIDVAVCFHVFEHIPDDLAAMRELGRTLKQDGFALLQVPYRIGAPTAEDPTADEEERIRRFGQADHVRWYGREFEERLFAAGMDATRFQPEDILPSETIEQLGLTHAGFIWLAQPLGSAGSMLKGEALVAHLRCRMTTGLLTAWSESASLLRISESNRARLRADRDALRRRKSVRAALAIANLARPAIRRWTDWGRVRNSRGEVQ